MEVKHTKQRVLLLNALFSQIAGQRMAKIHIPRVKQSTRNYTFSSATQQNKHTPQIVLKQFTVLLQQYMQYINA